MMTNVPDSNFIARGLVFNTNYTFEVQAINSYGTGPPADITVQTLPLQGINYNFSSGLILILIEFPSGIMIVYDDYSYQNNSIMNLDAEGGTLKCFTNKSGCCKFVSGGEGEWITPNRSVVNTRGVNGDFYRSRGAGVVNLMWTKNALVPQGMFCCEIPSSQNACIGVYPENEGIILVSLVMFAIITDYQQGFPWW